MRRRVVLKHDGRTCVECGTPVTGQKKLCTDHALQRIRDKCRVSTKAWRENNPDKAAASSAAYYQRNRAQRVKWQIEYQRERKLRRDPETFAKLVLSDASAAIPRGVPRDVRDDVTSRVVLGVLAREFKLADVAAKAKKFLAEESRRFWDVSLDDVIPGTTLRRIDTIEAPGAP